MSELKRTYYKNNVLKSEVFEINGKREGEYKIYYKNGQIQMIRNYVNGKKNGEYREVLNTDDLKYGGSGITNSSIVAGDDSHAILRIPPMATIWLELA